MEWIELCRRGEALGYHSFWVGDTSGTDAFVDAAYAMASTRSASVGIGVALPTRSPLQTACAAAALALPERTIVLGLGAGNAIANEIAHGVGYAPAVARIREFVACVTAVLRAPAGEPVELIGSHFRVRGPGLGVGVDQLKIALGAYGPVMTALAGEVTDGLIVHLLTPRSMIRQHLLRAESRHVGSRFLGAAGILISAHENEATAVLQARRVLANVLRLPRYAPRLAEVAPGADAANISDAVIREFALVTTPTRLLDEIAAFAEVDTLIPVPISLFMPAGRESDEIREAVLAGFLQRAAGAQPNG